MLQRIKDWWHALWVEHYEVTVWFEDEVITKIEDGTQTTTRSKKTLMPTDTTVQNLKRL